MSASQDFTATVNDFLNNAGVSCYLLAQLSHLDPKRIARMTLGDTGVIRYDSNGNKSTTPYHPRPEDIVAVVYALNLGREGFKTLCEAAFGNILFAYEHADEGWSVDELVNELHQQNFEDLKL